MNEKDPFGELKRLIDENPERITILEDEIDLKIQMEYYKYTRNAKKNVEKFDVNNLISDLFISDIDIDAKRNILTLLASIDDVAALRAIEKFRENPDSGLEQWSTLAWQESRMLISSNILDESPVFISTGLGGKDKRLRYSVGIVSIDDAPLNEFQQKILLSELEFGCKKEDCEIEDVVFEESVAVLTILIPLVVDIRNLFQNVLLAANQFGDFLRESFVVTNMYKISPSQIRTDFLKKKDDKDDLIIDFNYDEE